MAAKALAVSHLQRARKELKTLLEVKITVNLLFPVLREQN